jgi:hypothetical protein
VVLDELEFGEPVVVEAGLVEPPFGKPGFVGFGFVELGFVELLAPSKAFNLFFASAANFPLGYFCKYALKSSGFVLSLTVCQNASSVSALLVWFPLGPEDLGRLRFAAVVGTGFFGDVFDETGFGGVVGVVLPPFSCAFITDKGLAGSMAGKIARLNVLMKKAHSTPTLSGG